ncbi:flavodoxin domain-containing protein [Pseudobacteroides cellulosolvens]|uniref:Flavodoxin domain containing protein n=1 Tax=Pseudobacteroides cellulosolvens ATCC 35603 = DSM 2933 TaxID=398512 RepID=A0A0L6JV70_9FIRM|nr:flavodoxin domain-containing protein [Pseudobacteroides cellulosolvens]KNY29322.1 Flavodoxin domain containing protein [Pseudobacteroides cellulosolvens ATCC 35603 = DSM 2933]
MSILIVYATKHGTTDKCASLLKEKLNGEVSLHNLKNSSKPDLSKYDTVIIGGSIYAGRIQKAVIELCTQNISLLKEKKLGLFICCMFMDSAEAQLKNAFPEELLNNATAKESFGGEMIFSDMNFFEKTLTKIVSKTLAKNDPKLSGIDSKKDVSMIMDDNIRRFAQLINS